MRSLVYVCHLTDFLLLFNKIILSYAQQVDLKETEIQSLSDTNSVLDSLWERRALHSTTRSTQPILSQLGILVPALTVAESCVFP